MLTVLTLRNDQKVFSQPSYYCNFLYAGTNTLFTLCRQDYDLHRSEHLHVNIVLTLGMTRKHFHSPPVTNFPYHGIKTCFTLCNQNYQLRRSENWRKYNSNIEE